MPTYTYRCEKCREITEAEHPMQAKPQVVCEHCGSRKTNKVVLQHPLMARVLTRVGGQNASV